MEDKIREEGSIEQPEAEPNELGEPKLDEW